MTVLRPGENGADSADAFLEMLAEGLSRLLEGEFSARLDVHTNGIEARVASVFNDVAAIIDQSTQEVLRVARLVGREGKVSERVQFSQARGAWIERMAAINAMMDDLARPTSEVARVIDAVATGDLTQKILLEIDGQPVKGEFLRIGRTVNAMVDQLSSFAAEVSRVAKEVGTEGRLGGQAKVRNVSGVWKDLTDNVNFMASNLTSQVRNIAQVASAVAKGDLSQKITVGAKGEVAALADTINSMTDTLRVFAEQVTAVAREVGTEGKLGGQADVPGVAGTWKDLTDNVNFMASNLTAQVRNIAQVTTAVAKGDLSQKITVDVKGEILELKNTINTMVDQLGSFADEVTRVAREVGTEGRLGGQAHVRGVSGTWKDLTDNVNFMASNLTSQVRNIAQVTTAVAKGDLSQKITVDVKGEILELKNTINTMVDQLGSFADEVTRVAREVGTEGRLGGQAHVRGVSGTWKDLTDNVNFMASNLTAQVRNIAQVATAVAKGDLSQKITVDVKGEILELKDTINTMVDQLRSFADEVTRVAREVGTEGRLGGQAQVRGVSGTWKDLTDNVNFMASNLTSQVRNIAQVATAVAKGDLSQKITVDVKGEILELKKTINTMVDQLSAFAAEVTRVAREVGTEGKLGGQAEVEGVSGTWRRLTESVNQLAGNLTTQVRSIADVATAVTQGDHSRTIQVEASGEVAELKDNINQMIANLRETTQKNAEQDWLKTNLAKISGMLQGQRDLRAASKLIMSEVTPVVSAQHGAFFITEAPEGSDPTLRLIATYAYRERKAVPNRFKFGEGIVGQAAVERKAILVTEAPDDYIKITSGLGEATPVNVIALPLVFEDQVLGVIELASLHPFSEVSRMFLEQLGETIAVVLNSIVASMRTEELLVESQRLAAELQAGQEELKRKNAELEEQTASLRESEELLQAQQDQLQRSNVELGEKAKLLAEQNRAIESKNREIEIARQGLEEKARQLALTSKYKSEFLANMSHELRTPLNSLLIMAQMLAANPDGNLSDKQVEFSETIYESGSSLLDLINDILDLSKVEAGKLDLDAEPVTLRNLADSLEQSFRSVAENKDLEFVIDIDPSCAPVLTTDRRRLQQVLTNLLSNAFKFTERGGVTLRIAGAPPGHRFAASALQEADQVISFSVIDTGIGISSDKLELIFEAFQQADGTTSRRYGGTGLGLSISRELAGLLGGEIQVQSEPGSGSAFTLLVPLDRPVSATMIRVESGDQEWVDDDRANVKPGDRPLLIAAAEREMLIAMRLAARRNGFKTLIARSARTSIELARDYIPGTAVVARLLSDRDGMALLDHLKRDPDLRGLVTVAVSEPGDRATALRLGADLHIDAESLDCASVIDFLAHRTKRPAQALVIGATGARRDILADTLTAQGVKVSHGPGETRDDFDCILADLTSGAEARSFIDRLADEHWERPLIVIGQPSPFETGIALPSMGAAPVVAASTIEDALGEAAAYLPIERRHAGGDSLLIGRRLLIVDDDMRNVFALTNVFEEAGVEVVFAANGRDAIEVYESDPAFDLILMDIMMPELDGYEATRVLRTRGATLPIVALTAKAMKGDREKAIAAGASDYISKPVEIGQLMSVMRAWLARASAREAARSWVAMRT